MDWDKLIDDAHSLNEKHGTNIKGKKYSTVATRIELFRRRFGSDMGIETEVIAMGQAKGEMVVVKAIIHKDRNIIAMGHASEVIGAGMINATSALENCETSAIGRALASLGLHGGELASLDELRDKPPAQDKPHHLPADIEPIQRNPVEVATALVDIVNKAQNDGVLSARLKSAKFSEAWQWLDDEHPDEALKVRRAVDAAMLKFATPEAAE